VLWYQGESDSGSKETVEAFSERFKNLVAAIREDAGDPDLPFYYVQIARFVLPNGNHDWWNAIQEQQRLLENEIPNSGVVAAVDLALDDLIHIGTPGLKRLGKRLANLAVGATRKGPRLNEVERVPGGLRVSYSEVNGRLLPEGRVSGFSIRDASGQDLCLIYKQEVDLAQPTSVLLSLTGEAPAGARLYYGYGMDPFCNLTDSEDMAALAFGPYDLSE
jgi:sialate O-acetylesterase